MSHLSQSAGDAQPRLFSIQFPDLEVHDERRCFCFLPFLNGGLHYVVRQLTQIISTSDRHPGSGHWRCRRRNLQNGDAVIALMFVNEPSPRLHQEIPPTGHQAGVVSVASILELIQKSEIALLQPSIRKAESDHFATDRVFQQFL